MMRFSLSLSASGSGQLALRIGTSDIGNARTMARSMATLINQSMVLEYDDGGSAGVARETFAPGGVPTLVTAAASVELLS